MNIYKSLSYAYYLGMICLILGIFLKLNDSEIAFPLLILGYVPFLGIRLFNFLKGKQSNKRLNGILTVSALFLGVGILAILFNRSYWIIAIVITAVLDFYVSFRKYV